MNTCFDIIWSDEAKQDLDRIISDIEERWTMDDVSNFAVRLKKKEENISKNPRMYQKTHKDSAYRRTFVGRTAIYYKVLDDHVEIAILADTSEDPEKLDDKLSKY